MIRTLRLLRLRLLVCIEGELWQAERGEAAEVVFVGALTVGRVTGSRDWGKEHSIAQVETEREQLVELLQYRSIKTHTQKVHRRVLDFGRNKRHHNTTYRIVTIVAQKSVAFTYVNHFARRDAIPGDGHEQTGRRVRQDAPHLAGAAAQRPRPRHGHGRGGGGGHGRRRGRTDSVSAVTFAVRVDDPLQRLIRQRHRHGLRNHAANCSARSGGCASSGTCA